MRALVALGLATVFVLGGCAASPGGPTAGTPTTTATPALPPGATADDVVAFENLSDRERETFLAARNGSVTYGPRPCADEGSDRPPAAFVDDGYVRYEGAYYEVQVTPKLYLEKSYELRPADSAGGDAVDFGTLSETERSAVRRAFTDEYDTFACEGGAAFPGPDYVRYRNETYEVVNTLIADHPGNVLSVSKVEERDDE